MFSARIALGLPAFTPFSKSRISLDSPKMPNTPLFLFSRLEIPAASKPSFSMMKETAPPSMSPLRVPIIKPSSGVSPMLVSTHLPSLTAVMEPPLPMWQVMIFFPSGSTPKNSQTRFET